MRDNNFEKMQQDLQKMKDNLENMYKIEEVEHIRKKSNKRGRRAVEKKINRIEHPNITKIAKEEQIIVLATIFIVAVTFIFSTSIFAKTMSENTVETQKVEENTENSNDNVVEQEESSEKESTAENVVLESNENAIMLEDILLENVSVLKSKEYAEEERPIEFETEYTENAKLPEGEQIITQEGVNGKQQVTVIKSYENNVFVSENILDTVIMENYIPQKVDVGTSKFLATNKIHIGDTIYVIEDVTLREDSDKTSNEICTINKSLDVVLEDLESEDWSKVSYDGVEGYIENKYITSSFVTPGIVDANRRQKIKMSLSEDIALNQSTKLTLEDYKKVLSNNSSDKNKVIEDNAEVFYNMDKTYNMNGIFLASMAIHESGWATSTISKDKKNLFGYGAYDSSPYESSYSFDTYAEGIELVAKALVKYYLNEEGTPIYEDEVAKGSYYNGPTVADVNKRYASDTEWHNKIYKYMSYLYDRL